jgi:hypothetical protein
MNNQTNQDKAAQATAEQQRADAKKRRLYAKYMTKESERLLRVYMEIAGKYYVIAWEMRKAWENYENAVDAFEKGRIL